MTLILKLIAGTRPLLRFSRIARSSRARLCNDIISFFTNSSAIQYKYRDRPDTFNGTHDAFQYVPYDGQFVSTMSAVLSSDIHITHFNWRSSIKRRILSDVLSELQQTLTRHSC
jgi:hypothetical protein